MTARKHNTDRQGGAWSEDMKKKVWAKGMAIEGKNTDQYRNDKCGNLMEYSRHGDRDSINGWEIDHINPVSNGGTDDLSNLQPLHWKNNAEKADSLTWKCK